MKQRHMETLAGIVEALDEHRTKRDRYVTFHVKFFSNGGTAVVINTGFKNNLICFLDDTEAIDKHLKSLKEGKLNECIRKTIRCDS
jgi:hypothetical protein